MNNYVNEIYLDVLIKKTLPLNMSNHFSTTGREAARRGMTLEDDRPRDRHGHANGDRNVKF